MHKQVIVNSQKLVIIPNKFYMYQIFCYIYFFPLKGFNVSIGNKLQLKSQEDYLRLCCCASQSSDLILVQWMVFLKNTNLEIYQGMLDF